MAHAHTIAFWFSEALQQAGDVILHIERPSFYILSRFKQQTAINFVAVYFAHVPGYFTLRLSVTRAGY